MLRPKPHGAIAVKPLAVYLAKAALLVKPVRAGGVYRVGSGCLVSRTLPAALVLVDGTVRFSTRRSREDHGGPRRKKEIALRAQRIAASSVGLEAKAIDLHPPLSGIRGHQRRENRRACQAIGWIAPIVH
jgi:hypothetical protein